jgi:DinB superfamily
MLDRIIEILESTPTKIAAEVAPLTESELRIRPRSGCWSIIEVVAHLDDAEELAMRARIAEIVAGGHPTLREFDQNRRASDMRYLDKQLGSVLESFTAQRKRNVAWIRTLEPAQLAYTGTHPKVGTLSASDLLHEWAFHDLGHLKQILEIKRYALYPHIGNMKQFYTLQWG